MGKSVYIVLSQTGTMFSRALKFFTRAEYNHASISLTPDLNKMYSFGRLNPYNPFVGGFVEEGKNKGTFKRFDKTKAMVLQLKVTEYAYKNIKFFIEYFINHRVEFHYNYLGVLFACFKLHHKSSKRFYCSEFVNVVLSCDKVRIMANPNKLVKPEDFKNIDGLKLLYEGKICDYDKRLKFG